MVRTIPNDKTVGETPRLDTSENSFQTQFVLRAYVLVLHRQQTN